MSRHRLYQSIKTESPDKDEQQTKDLPEAWSEILGLRAQLRRLEEERELLRNSAWYVAKEPE